VPITRNILKQKFESLLAHPMDAISALLLHKSMSPWVDDKHSICSHQALANAIGFHAD
jgi:hypothetical protein